MKKLFLTAMAVASAAAVFLAGCSDIEAETNTAEVSDISKSITFNSISQQGFMGGSVLYNPDDESKGQLAKNVTIAFRLGYVEKAATKSDEFVYTDMPEKAQFGTMHITSVNLEQISFNTSLFDSDGIALGDNTFTITLNQSADINGDGLPDVEYKIPSRKRAGLEKAIYLNFLSSQATLNTSMFAVLPEQYSRGVYPNGLLGINPDGKFIVRKYEDTENTSRSAVSGTLKGDYVLDTSSGKYQRVIKANNSRTARAVQDDELEDIDESELAVSYRFSESDIDEESAQNLYEVLPDNVKTVEGLDTIEKLNKILENKDLIQIIKSIREIPIDDDIYDDVIAELAALSSEEIVQLNRIFLEECYPNYCPQVSTNSTAFTEILPLVSVKFGDSYDENENSDLITGGRAASAYDYDNQKKSIQNEFNSYKHLKTIGLDKRIRISFIDASLSDSYVSIGMKGNFSASWGSLNTNLRGVVMFQISAKTRFETSRNGNLLDIESGALSYPVFSCGPIILSVNGSLGVSIPFSANLSSATNLSTETQFTGLYGCGFSIGLDYGVKWKKKWFVRYPRPYANWNSSRWSCNRSAYYINPSIASSFESISGNISIHPQVKLSIGADINKTVWGDLSLIPGIKTGLDFIYKDSSFNGTAYADLTLKREVSASVGLKGIPILNKLSYSKNWDLGTLNYRLAKWSVHK
ncbi:MAG: hypothetical protein IJ673_05820 [Treponema sp.]|nr:hypothetical protein [Treponema sp.]